MTNILSTIAKGQPGRRRVQVFYYPYDGFGGPRWTWCWEIDGEPQDYAGALPRCTSWRDALGQAMAAVGLKAAP